MIMADLKMEKNKRTHNNIRNNLNHLRIKTSAEVYREDTIDTQNR